MLQQLPKQPRIFVIQPFGKGFEAVYAVIREAVHSIGGEVQRADEIAKPGNIIEQVYAALEGADVIIADVSLSNPNVLYELGFAHAAGKPCILIAQDVDHLPFDIATVRTIIYDLKSKPGLRILHNNLKRALHAVIEHPAQFSEKPTTDTTRRSVFISYSHRDAAYLERLMVHLRPLEKSGLIDLWADTKLEAGDKWKAEIETALRRARIAILLISADFLASNFIVDNELPPILTNAEAHGTRILPVVVGHCRFIRDENLNRFHAINDPSKPVASLDENAREAVFDKVAAAIERALGGPAVG